MDPDAGSARETPDAFSVGSATATLAASSALHEADRARDEQRTDRALELYRAHVAAIDPRSPEGRARLNWILSTVAAHDPAFAPALRSAAEHADDPDLALRAAVVASAVDVSEERYDDAEQILKRALRASRGEHPGAEIGAALGLTRLFRIQRRLFEALVMSRRALDLAQAVGDAWAEAVALQYLGSTLVELSDWCSLERCVDALAAVAPRLDKDRRGLVLRAIATLHIVLEPASDDLVAARAALGRWLAGPFHAWQVPDVERQTALYEARALLIERRPTEALALVSQHGAFDAPPEDAGGPRGWNSDALFDAELALRCRIAVHESAHPADGPADCTAGCDGGAIAAAALEWIDAVETHGVGVLGTARVVTLVGHLAESLTTVPAAEPATSRALDVAARAALRRIYELESCVRDLDELRAGPATAQDEERLTAYRLRFAKGHEEVLNTLALDLERQGATRAGDDPGDYGAIQILTDIADPDGALCICAWCLRVRMAQSTWLPLGHYVPKAPALHVTHGMCPTCATTFKPKP